MQVRWSSKKDPGVAKFGIALEWGSRGLEFESQHSDQKVPKSFWLRNFFCYLLYAIIEKNHPFYDWKRLQFRLSIEIIMFMY